MAEEILDNEDVNSGKDPLGILSTSSGSKNNSDPLGILKKKDGTDLSSSAGPSPSVDNKGWADKINQIKKDLAAEKNRPVTTRFNEPGIEKYVPTNPELAEAVGVQPKKVFAPTNPALLRDINKPIQPTTNIIGEPIVVGSHEPVKINLLAKKLKSPKQILQEEQEAKEDAINNTIAIKKGIEKDNPGWSESNERAKLEKGLYNKEYEVGVDAKTGKNTILASNNTGYYDLAGQLNTVWDNIKDTYHKMYQKETEDEAYAKLSKPDKIGQLNTELYLEDHGGGNYLPQAEDKSIAGWTGRNIAQLGYPLLKASAYGAGAVTGATLLGAPVASGAAAELMGAPAQILPNLKQAANVMSFFNDMSTANSVDNEKRVYKDLIKQGVSQDEAFDKAQMAGTAGAISGGFGAVAMGGAFKNLKSAATNVNVQPFISSLKHLAGEGAAQGGFAAAGSLLQDIGAKAAGLRISDEDILNNSWDQFKNMAGISVLPAAGIESVRRAFESKHGAALTQALGIVSGAVRVPKPVVAQAKEVVSQLPQADVQAVYDAAEQNGVIPQGSTQKIMTSLDNYNKTELQIPQNLPDDVKASLKGLQEKINELEFSKSKLDKGYHPYMDAEIQKLRDKATKILSTGDVFSHETDDLGNPINNPQGHEIQKDITVGEMLDKRGTYNQEIGQFYQDGQTIVFKPDESNKIYEIGNVDEMSNIPASKLGIKAENSSVEINENGNPVVRGKEYVNNYSDPTQAINRDKEGNVVSVSLETPTGQKRTFKGNVAEDLAYQITLGKNAKPEIAGETEVAQPVVTKENVPTKEAPVEVKLTPLILTPTEEGKTKKTVADTVADDLLSHLGITPTIEGEIPPAKKYTAENIDTISDEGLNDTQKKVLTDVKNVVNSISKLVKKTTGNPLEVNVHTSPASYEKAVLDAGGSKQDSSTKGFYLDSNGTIHLNMDKVTTDTMLHEGFHPVLDYMAKNRPDIINDLHKQLEKVTGGKEVIENANKIYEDFDETTKKKEAITDFIAKVADGTIKIDKTNFEKVRDFVINAINKLGFDLGKDINNITDLKDLAKLVSEKFNKGEEIYNGDFKEITKSEAQGDILAAGKINDKNIEDSKVGNVNPIKFSRDKFEEKELSKLPVRSLKDVLSEFGNKAIAINTDPTRVGKLKLPSGKEIFMYGGPNYSALKENVDNNIGFASTALSKPKQVRGAINAMNEGGKGLILVTTQKPESMLGNAYALENTLDAITMLPKKILKSSEFRNEFFGKDIVAVKDAFGKHYDEFVKKYGKADFSSPEVLDNMIKDLLSDIGNNFKARNSLVDNLLAGIVEKSKRAATKNEPGYVSVEPNKFISKALFDNQGLNQEKLFYNIGEKGIVEAYMNEGKWGFITNGFTSDANVDHLSIQDKGIIHPQFNAKFHGENPFILDGAYLIDKLWTPKVMTENAKGEPYIDTKTGEPKPFTLKSSQLVSQSMYPKGEVNEPNIKPDVEKGVPQFSKEDQENKIKEFIDIQRKKGVSDEDIKAGLDKVSDKIGLDANKIDELISGKEEQPKITGSSRKAVAGLAQRLGLKEPEPGHTLKPEEYKRRGQILLKGGATPEDIDNRADFELHDRISIGEAHAAELQKQLEKIAKSEPEGRNSVIYKDKLAELNKYLDRTGKLNTLAAHAFTSLQGGTDLDTGSFTAQVRRLEKAKGKDATEAEKQQVEKFTTKDQKLQQEATDAEAKFIEQLENEHNPKVTKKEVQKSQTYTEKAKKVADRFRKIKTTPFTFKDENGNEIPIQKQGIAWNDVVEAGAKAIEKTGEIADGVVAIIDAIKDNDWYKNLSDRDKDKLEKDLTAHYESAIKETPEAKNIKRLEKELEDLKQGKVKQQGPKRELSEREKELMDQIQDEKEKLGLVKSKMEKPLTEVEQKQKDEEELGKLQKQFVDKKDNKFTPEESKTIWNYAKNTYYNKGFSFPESIAKTAEDLGLKNDQVSNAIITPKTKAASGEMYTKRSELNKNRQALQRYIDNRNESKFDKAVKTIVGVPKAAQTFGHSHVFIGTHAITNILDPRHFIKTLKAVENSYRFSYEKNPTYYESHMDALRNDPLFEKAKKAGLQNDPDNINFDSEQAFQKYLGKFGKAGERGFNAVKVLRQEIFNYEYNKLSESEKKDEKALERIAGLINNWTGGTNIDMSGDIGSLVKGATFSSSMEGSRWEKILAPFKAATYISKSGLSKVNKGLATLIPSMQGFIKDATPSQKAYSKAWAGRAGRQLGTYLLLLGANSAIQHMVNPDKEVNWTHPTRPDWLLPKFGSHDVTVDLSGGLLTTIGLLATIAKISFENERYLPKNQNRTEALTGAVGKYIRGKLSPIASLAIDLAFRRDYSGNVVPYSSDVPAPGKRKLGWGEYIANHFAPLPIAEGIKETKKSAQDSGVSDAQWNDIMKGLLSGTTSFLTGLKLKNIFDKAENEGPSDNIINYKKGGKLITDEEYNQYKVLRNKLFDKYVDEVKKNGITVEFGERVPYAKYQKEHKEEFNKEINRLKTYAAEQAKESLFGKKEKDESNEGKEAQRQDRQERGIGGTNEDEENQ